VHLVGLIIRITKLRFMENPSVTCDLSSAKSRYVLQKFIQDYVSKIKNVKHALTHELTVYFTQKVTRKEATS